MARARTLDPQGHRWSLDEAGRVRDETSGGDPVVLPRPDPPCLDRTVSSIAVDARGAVMAVSEGRLFVRRPGAGNFAMTPVCSDLEGAPWTVRTLRGWAAIARRLPHTQPALLMTDDLDGAFGWYAVTALDLGVTHVVLSENGAWLSLLAGSYGMFDARRSVAGAIAAAGDARWSSLTNGPAGALASRDDGATHRELVLGTVASGHFERERRARPAHGGTTRAVHALDADARVAVTDTGLEYSADVAEPFMQVFVWPAPPPRQSWGVGRDTNGAPAFVGPSSGVSTDCTGDAQDAGTPSPSRTVIPIRVVPAAAGR